MILRSRGAPFTDEEIESISDREGWNWIYSNKPVYTPKPHMTEICFTGFRKEEKDELEEKANSIGFKIARSVTKKLDYLCIGETAGPSKLKKPKNRMLKLLRVKILQI